MYLQFLYVFLYVPEPANVETLGIIFIYEIILNTFPFPGPVLSTF